MIQASLDRIVAPGRTAMPPRLLDELKRAVEGRLAELAPGPGPGSRLDAAIRQALLANGKRLRPLLATLACQELGGDWRDALDAACAVEMVHAASLVLDDLPAMDDASLRRGEPATHVRFGEDVAILASVSLLALAFETLGQSPGLDPASRARAVAVLAKAVGSQGLSAGQHADLSGPGDLSAERLASTYDRKTGVLFVSCVELGALAAGASPGAADPLRLFARELGQAFQILDDLADGGPGGGEDAGKATLLSVLGRAESRRRLRAHRDAALAGLRRGGELATFAEAIFDAAPRVLPHTARVAAGG